MVRNEERWSREEIREIHNSPVLDLIHRAATVHREFHQASQVQMCALLSIKTGGCPEDCAYCPQAARYQTDVEVDGMMPIEQVVQTARQAQENGASRFCMGAAWRDVPDGPDFERVLEMVEAVSDLGLEVCCTLGMLTEPQAQRLADAGLYAYNHNVDTSEAFYGSIITTRGYQERLRTIEHVRNSGITVCCGGIIGMGESAEDRISMLHLLANLDAPPESVPINALVPVPGTPLADRPRVSVWEMVRMIASARITMPHSMVRLSAGRTEMSIVEQALCFLAGANSIFVGDRLLTTPNPDHASNAEMFELLGLSPLPVSRQPAGATSP